MQVCKYASMQVCKYASMQACLYASMQVCKYASMLVCEYACMQVCKYACMQVCKYACMQVCMYACMHVCKYASMLVCKYVFLGRLEARLGDGDQVVEVGQVPGDQVTREVGQVRRRLVQGRLASVDSDVGRQGGARLCLHPPLQAV